jgi:hypothetical protein
MREVVIWKKEKPAEWLSDLQYDGKLTSPSLRDLSEQRKKPAQTQHECCEHCFDVVLHREETSEHTSPEKSMILIFCRLFQYGAQRGPQRLERETFRSKVGLTSAS